MTCLDLYRCRLCSFKASRSRYRGFWASGLLLLALTASGLEARTPRLETHNVALDLPGIPESFVSGDFDGDGHQDLAVVVAYSEWDQVTVSETSSIDEIEGLVESLTIVPAMVERRELYVFQGSPDGFVAAAQATPLGRELLSLAPGPTAAPLLALVDSGLTSFRVTGGGGVDFHALVAEPPTLAGAGIFLPELGLTHDLDGDGQVDVLLPAQHQLSVYVAADGFERRSATIPLPTDAHRLGGRQRLYPLPEVIDVDGDGLPDLLFQDPELGWDLFHLVLNRGPVRNRSTGRFEDVLGPVEPPFADPGVGVWVGDIEGDGRLALVTQESLEKEKAGALGELREAKRPRNRYRFYRVQLPASGAERRVHMAAEPYAVLEAEGYTFESVAQNADGEIYGAGGLRDLDGDGRQDLITLTLDFSVMQFVRAVTARRVSIGLGFHIYCQGESGRLTSVPNLDLSGRFKLDLNDLNFGSLPQFDGDFDGDGRFDFLQAGRGRQLTIHLGKPRCGYDDTPDYSVELEQPPRDLALLRIADYDADGLDDLLVIQPRRSEEGGVGARLEIYLNRGFDR